MSGTIKLETHSFKIEYLNKCEQKFRKEKTCPITYPMFANLRAFIFLKRTFLNLTKKASFLNRLPE